MGTKNRVAFTVLCLKAVIATAQLCHAVVTAKWCHAVVTAKWLKAVVTAKWWKAVVTAAVCGKAVATATL